MQEDVFLFLETLKLYIHHFTLHYFLYAKHEGNNIVAYCVVDKQRNKFGFLTLAAPVLLGMMLKLAALPPLQSLDEGPSTVFWVAIKDPHMPHYLKKRNI